MSVYNAMPSVQLVQSLLTTVLLVSTIFVLTMNQDALGIAIMSHQQVYVPIVVKNVRWPMTAPASIVNRNRKIVNHVMLTRSVRSVRNIGYKIPMVLVSFLHVKQDMLNTPIALMSLAVI